MIAICTFDQWAVMRDQMTFASDLLGERDVPAGALTGAHTARG
jgi:hypothetical protein